MEVWALKIYREFQLFLVGYIIVSICEIFTVGGFPLQGKVRLVGVLKLHSNPEGMLTRMIGFHSRPPGRDSRDNMGALP